jgi:predicted transcriptional regulator
MSFGREHVRRSTGSRGADARPVKIVNMRRNQRKLQILRLLADNALSIEEIADVSEISTQSAAMCVLRYRRQGLIVAKINGVYSITSRGLNRITYIEKTNRLEGSPPLKSKR